MKDLALQALEAARRSGAVYADVRTIEHTAETITLRNDDVLPDRREEQGVAVRARFGGAWGFAATAEVDPKAIRAAAQEAVAAARAGALLGDRGALARGAPGPARYETAAARDPFAVPLAEKIALGKRAIDAARRNKEVTVAQCRLRFLRERAWIATSEGGLSERILRFVGAGVKAFAVGAGRAEVRTAPAQGGGVWTGGLERLERLDLEELGARAGREAASLLRAPRCPQGARDVVLDPWAAAVLLHETLGHALEGDARSFLAGASVGRTLVGSPWLNLGLDPTVGGGGGTIGIDDEGMTPRAAALVSRGVVMGFVTDRETAELRGAAATGSARADGFREPPRPRLTNLALAPGSGDLGSLLADTDGIYVEGVRAYTVDPERKSFRLAAEIAWEVRRGKKTRVLRGAAIGGTTSAIWQSCDAVAGPRSTAVAGLWCVRRSQRVPVGHALPPLRLRRVPVGPSGS